MRIKRWIRSSWFIEHLTLRREESLALSYWQNDDCSPGDSTSSNHERIALRRRRGEPEYIGILQQRAGSLNVKRLLLIIENQIPQIKEFSAFLYVG